MLLPGQAPAANIILAFEYGGGWRDIQVPSSALAVDLICMGWKRPVSMISAVIKLCLVQLLLCKATVPQTNGRWHAWAVIYSIWLGDLLLRLLLQGSVIMTVLTYLLGGGNSFSSGGPGKGMHR